MRMRALCLTVSKLLISRWKMGRPILTNGVFWLLWPPPILFRVSPSAIGEGECRRWPFNGSTFLRRDLQAPMINCQERGSCHLAYDLCALCPNHLLRGLNSGASIGTASPPICVTVKGAGNVATPTLLSHHAPAGLRFAICEGTFFF